MNGPFIIIRYSRNNWVNDENVDAMRIIDYTEKNIAQCLLLHWKLTKRLAPPESPAASENSSICWLKIIYNSASRPSELKNA